MPDEVGVRELCENPSRCLDRVKAGENLVIMEHGTVVARLVPAGGSADAYADLAAYFSATVPAEPLEAIAARLSPPSAPAGTTDGHLAEDRRGT